MSDLLTDMRILVGSADTSFRAVVLARSNSVALNEVSLGRVYQHLQSASNKAFAILTSWRQGVPERTNKQNFKALEGKIRGAGLGFFKLVGHWKEEGQSEATAEPSLFIPSITKALATKLGNEYEQDAVIYGGPETQGLVTLIFNGGGEQSIGKVSSWEDRSSLFFLTREDFYLRGLRIPSADIR